MNNEEPYRDQAERLRQKIEKTKNDFEIKKELPTRSDIHRNKKNKTKWKLKYPVIRILVLFFTLLPIAILSAYFALSDNKLLNSEKVNSEKSVEEINIKEEQKEDVEGSDSNIDDVESLSEDSEKKVSKVEAEVGTQMEQESNLDNGHTNLPSTDKDQTTSKVHEQKASIKLVYHTVQSNETLYRIAMKYYKSQSGIEIIRQANQMQGNEIQAGQVLKIPK